MTKLLFIVLILLLPACNASVSTPLAANDTGQRLLCVPLTSPGAANEYHVPSMHAPELALVAHAAAVIEGYAGSNSLEAMQNAAALGFSYIELDMITTSDGKIVLNHSWDSVSNRIPGVHSGIMTYEEFMGHRIFNQFTPVNLDMLIEFLRENPGPRIITDTKDTDYAALYAIAEFFPDYMYRFIPQVYQFDDAARIRALGFDDIILTVYMMGRANQNPTRIHSYALENQLYGVAIPDTIATRSFTSQINIGEVRYFVHTIDDRARALELLDMGFYGIYTGFLAYISELSGFTRVPYPVPGISNRISQNFQSLSNEQQELTQSAIFYKINVPVYVHNGEVLPVWAWYLVGAPFISPLTGQVYLVDRNFSRYVQERVFCPRERVLRVTIDGQTHQAGGDNFYELFIYHNMLFISESVVERLYNLRVLRQGDYIVLVPLDCTRTQEKLFEVAGRLFAND